MAEHETDGNLTGQMALIEAGLYVTGRPLTLKTLGSIIGVRSEEKIKRLVRRLIERYEANARAIQILVLKDGRCIMQLKPEFSENVKRLITRKLLTKGPLKTLSFIAFKQPITRAYVAKVRGKPAYQHIRQLREMGLISEERLGKTSIIRTTEAFSDYFNLSHNPKVMRQQLEAMFRTLEDRQETEKTI